MSVEPHDAHLAAQPLLARAAAAERRVEARLATAIDDFFLAENDRLDDRTRAGMTALVATTVAAVEHDVAGHAAKLLLARGVTELPGSTASLLPRLIESGLLRDGDLMAELIGQVRQDMLGESLLANRGPDAPPNLLARLAACPDTVVSTMASAYLVADSRRRAAVTARRSELPAELHHRIVWWIAAALRERHVRSSDAQATIDRALVDAALRSLSAHDEGERLEAVAMRLAAAIDARPAELAELLIDALAEGRIALFIAAIAHAQAIDYTEARGLVLDPDGDRMWLALRGHGCDRATIARIGFALAEADHRRDLEAFADLLDTIVAIPCDTARAALAPLGLNRDFRIAVRALARSVGR